MSVEHEKANGFSTITQAQGKELWQRFKKDAAGLVAAIAQDALNHDVLMIAWMNEESFLKTLETGFMHYYSRSRRELWFKGGTSGHVQKVVSASIDCDNDALLFQVEQ